ncbi:hypothetical protein ANCCAN_23083 [Ancylostoma caninum]|uniref:CUB domain-containing protein n=1 Tax=Ancylostoma caninum TaxID=29170 RepID=A0A368FG51_ANCCA|nr:hypothetical protein ANCCAN_23083 [Ancylostoma caninum]
MLLATLLLFGYFLQVHADLCPKGWQFVPQSSYCIMVSSQLFSADDASSYCKSQGSDLATLTLQSELSALTNEPSIYGDCATLRSSGMTACPCYNQQPALCKFKPQLCNGGEFGGPNVRSGTIISPGYPDQYYNNLDCYYQIEGD